MNSSRVAVVAAGATVLLWAAKAVAIGTAGGLGRSRLEGPLFLAGFVCMLVSVVATGLALTTGRPVLQRSLSGAGAVVGAVVVTVLTQGIVGLVEPTDPGWAWGEVNLWVLALVATVLATWTGRRAPVSSRLAD
jgi:hypothetical protein